MKFPIFLIIVGVLWLLAELDIFYPVGFIWPMALFFSGVCVFACAGFHKGSFVLGAMLWVAAALVVLCKFDFLTVSVSFPLFLIALGGLMALNASPLIPRKSK